MRLGWSGLACLAAGMWAANSPGAPPRVLCSTFPVYQITRNVTAGREGMAVELLLPAALGCPHQYAVKPADLEKLSRADLLVLNGLGLEEFLEPQIRSAGERLKVVDSSLGIGDLLPAAGAGSRPAHADCAGCAHDDDVNPHLFASPRRIARIAIRIAEALAEADPAGAELYGRNARAYAERMDKLAGEMAARVAAFPNRRIVQPHGVFDYLARDTGLEIVAVTQAHGQEPSAAEMLSLLKRIREVKAAAVVTEPQYSPRAGQTLAREAGLPVLPLDPAASGPEAAPLDYVETVMKANLEALQSALGR